jgi:opacity protein-like surface antigen
MKTDVVSRFRLPAACVGLVTALALTGSASAQTRPTPAGVTVRGVADLGMTSFAASESFKAVLGSSSGPVFGGGVELVERSYFLVARVARFRNTGERIAHLRGEIFNLGIPATVTIIPFELSGGYRFRTACRVVPYAGGGIGWHRYRETSEFSSDDESVSETFTGYHLLGGAELRLSRYFGVGGEAQWTTVPDALGQDPGGISTEFGETNLGGFTLRAKLVIGR